jgi:hypothetical protein
MSNYKGKNELYRKLRSDLWRKECDWNDGLIWIILNWFIKVLKNTVICADDQVIISDSEVNLERGAIKLQYVAKHFGMEISLEKPETMTFLGQDPVRCKIVVENKFL